jgi:hypothetical protein
MSNVSAQSQNPVSALRTKPVMIGTSVTPPHWWLGLAYCVTSFKVLSLSQLYYPAHFNVLYHLAQLIFSCPQDKKKNIGVFLLLDRVVRHFKPVHPVYNTHFIIIPGFKPRIRHYHRAGSNSTVCPWGHRFQTWLAHRQSRFSQSL